MPGKPPYRRGIYADMYQGRPWTIRQLSGAGTPDQVNSRIKFLLNNGATGVNLLFDVPTIQMYDSGEPESAGMVGVVGVPIDTVEDMEATFKDIPVDEISVSLVTHYPSNTAILMAMYLVMAERRGILWAKLKGSVQNDFIMEEVVRNAVDFISPRKCFELQCQNIEYLTKYVPQFNAATFNGYNLREFGADIVLESAVALLNGYETLQAVPKAKVSFFWCVGNQFFDEIARLRAVREVWYNMTGQKLRCHVQTSGISLTKEEYLNNITRSAYHAMAAVLGGCQSLHVDSYDEAYSVPSEASSLVSLRTQQILQIETGIMDEPDPLGGSYYIEKLTDTMVEDIRNTICAMGSIVGAVESGWLRAECIRNQSAQLPQVKFSSSYLPTVSSIHIDKPERCIGISNVSSTNIALGPDIMLGCIEAIRKGATVGQLRRAILSRYGRWQRA